jgi:type I restriction enzyme S subunit
VTYPVVSISSVAEINPRKWTEQPNEDDEVSFVPMASVEVESGILDATNVRLWERVKKGYTRFEEGDILVAKITPSMENGKAALAVGLAGGRGAGSTEFHVLRPSEKLDAKFLLHYVLQTSTRRAARAQMRGVAGQLRVPPEFYREYEIPLPPLDEQRKIVEAIETQFTRLDDAVAALNRAQTRLKRYRASVLKAACEGTLVPTEAELARQEGRSYESASALLERMKAEREAAPGKKRGKATKAASLDTLQLAKLPEGWAWTSFGELISKSEYGTSTKCDYEYTGPPVLRIPNMIAGTLNFTDMKFASAEHAVTGEEALIRGDLLVCRTNGSVNLVGRSALVKETPSSRYWFASYLLRFRFFESKTVPWWLHNYLWSPHARKWIEQHAASSAGQNNVSLSLINGMPVPMPPLAEQARIVEEVERRLSVIEQMEAMVETNLKRAESLRQSILRMAFSGKLHHERHG